MDQGASGASRERAQAARLEMGRVATGAACVRAAGLVAVLGALPLHAHADCARSQQAVFSCSTGAKTVSVCASADLTANSGRLQYRFGRPSAVEISYPPADADWRGVTRGNTLVYSGGGGAYLAFANAPYRYVVYSAFGRGWGSKAGVVVEKGGKRVASLACKGKVSSALGPDWFARAGIEAGGDDFELP